MLSFGDEDQSKAVAFQHSMAEYNFLFLRANGITLLVFWVSRGLTGVNYSTCERSFTIRVPCSSFMQAIATLSPCAGSLPTKQSQTDSAIGCLAVIAHIPLDNATTGGRLSLGCTAGASPSSSYSIERCFIPLACCGNDFVDNFFLVLVFLRLFASPSSRHGTVLLPNLCLWCSYLTFLFYSLAFPFQEEQKVEGSRTGRSWSCGQTQKASRRPW